MSGFGREPFGKHPYGKSNFGADSISRVFPKSTLEKDNNGRLQRYLLTIENSANDRRTEIANTIDLIDPDRIRSDLLVHLADMLALTLDENEPLDFQRTLVRDAVQYYQVKGTEKSYKIRGLISGFDVEIRQVWNFDEIYLPFIPEEDRLEFPPGSGSVSGIWYTNTPPSEVAGVSAVVPETGNCTYCLTSFIRLSYTLVRCPDAPVIGNLLDRVLEKVRQVMPIHVRDIFIDLTIRIEAEFEPEAYMCIEEETCVAAGYADRYDIIAADVITTDRRIVITNGNT